MTQDDETQDDQTHEVVIDGEGRHSLWPLERSVPAGWSPTGFRGARQACLDHVDVVWRDQRPLSLREARDER